MGLYRKGRAGADFDAGIAMALTAVLTNPEFLLRVESDPKKLPPGGSFFGSAIWNWRRAYRSSYGAAFRTTNCSTLRFAAN
jgi:hypothetical protein